MPRNSISIASAIDKNKIASNNPWLIMLDIEVVDPIAGVVTEVLHLVRNTEDVTYHDDLYVAADFDIELQEEAGSQTTITLSIKDYYGVVQGRMEQYGGGVGFNVTVKVISAEWLNTSMPPELEEFFQVVASTSQNYTIEFQLGAENVLYMTFPRRRQTRDFCQWRYKGDECGYAGPLPSCDLTLQGNNGCAVHSNTQRFGGYPGINSNGVRYA